MFLLKPYEQVGQLFLPICVSDSEVEAGACEVSPGGYRIILPLSHDKEPAHLQCTCHLASKQERSHVKHL